MKTPPAAISREGFDELFQKVSNWGVWGNDDERGTPNYITPECVRTAAALVRTGRTVSMAVRINKVCKKEQRSEFLVVAAPLRLPGGTGSFINPIAIF